MISYYMKISTFIMNTTDYDTDALQKFDIFLCIYTAFIKEHLYKI